MSTLPAELQQVLDRWVAAELAGDAAALDAVLHPQFLFAGPFGYLLDREQWLARFTAGDQYHTVFTSFDFTVDIPVRVIRDTALVVGTQEQTGTHQEEPVDGQFRSTVVLIRDRTGSSPACTSACAGHPERPRGRSSKIEYRPHPPCRDDSV